MIVDDFKRDGLWANEILPRKKGERFVTMAYSHYHNMRSRTTKGNAANLMRPNYSFVENKFTDFQEFAEWCQYQIGYKKRSHLDKDLLSGKFYSKETCVFLPVELNILLIKRERGRGKLPIGVTLHKQTGKYLAQCSERSDRQNYLGLYLTPTEAFIAYKMFKENFIKQQANKWKDQIDPRAYKALMNYEVLITD